MVYEYKRVFGKADPIASASGFEAYDEEKMFVMHNITDEILDGTLDNMTWSELPYDVKMRKIINYANNQKATISDTQCAMLRAELITLLSKRKLNKDYQVEYDAESKNITNIPCVVYDPVTECYNFIEKSVSSSIKKTILQENISKI